MDSIEKAAAAIDASMNGSSGKAQASDDSSTMDINDLFGHLGSPMEGEDSDGGGVRSKPVKARGPKAEEPDEDEEVDPDYDPGADEGEEEGEPEDNGEQPEEDDSMSTTSRR